MPSKFIILVGFAVYTANNKNYSYSMPKGRRTCPSIRFYIDYDLEGEMDYNSKIFTAFSRNLATEIVNNPEGCTLPGNLGHMRVIGNTSGSINKKVRYALIAAGKADVSKVAHTNAHTDGKVFRITWYSKVIGKFEEKVKPAFFNSDIYVFKTSHFLKCALKDICLNTTRWADYYVKITVPRKQNKPTQQ